MNTEIKPITDKEVWEQFTAKCKERTFLNSWNWGEFYHSMGHKIWRLGVYEQGLISIALVIKIKARRGSFFFIPHGPCVQNLEAETQKKVLNSIVAYLKDRRKQEEIDFIRISPSWERGSLENVFKELGFRTAQMHTHPELTWKLDIRKPEDELLKGMRKTTRYLIRQGLKNEDVEVTQSEDISDIEKFNSIYQTTAGRHNFTPFSLDYLQKEFSAFSEDRKTAIFLGKYKNEIIASAVIIYWQGVGFYHQGASSQKYPKIPITYLMQWMAIKEAKKRGCAVYNFWGIAPEGSKKTHPWAGLTLFKKGFGGYKTEYIKTQDLAITKKYWLNFFVEKFRKIKRRL